MANIHLALATQVAILKAVKACMDAGTAAVLEIYTSPRPATADTALDEQILLGTLTFSSTCAADPTTGVMTFSAITKDSGADADGVASWGRVLTQSAGSVIFDGTCGVAGSGACFILSSIDIVTGVEIICTAATLTMPSGV
jgi:hypothetical protein